MLHSSLLLILALALAWLPQGLERAPWPYLLWAFQVTAVARSGWLLARRALPRASGAERALAAFLLAYLLAAAISTWTALFLRTTWLTVALTSACVSGAIVRITRRDPLPSAAPAAPRTPDLPAALERFSLAFALSALAIVAWVALRGTVQNSDAMWYHLPHVVEWLQSGSLAPSELIAPIARAYPPLRAGVLLFLTLPIGNEHLGLLGPLELSFLVLGAYALAREAGLGRSLALAVASLVPAFPAAARAAELEGTDVWLALALVASLLYGSRWLRGRARGDLWLTGLALGGLAGAKYSGLVLAGALGAAWLVAVVSARPEPGRRRELLPRLERALPLVLAPLLVAGPYYLRNLVFLANPLWPARVTLFGRVLCDGPYGPAELSPTVLGFDWGSFTGHLRHYRQGFGWTVLLPAAAPLLALLAWLGRRRGGREALVHALLPAALFLAYLRQPFSRPRAHYLFTMRFLIGWAVVGSLVAWRALGLLLGEGVALNALAALLPLWPTSQWTRQWPIPLGMGLASALLPACAPAIGTLACTLAAALRTGLARRSAPAWPAAALLLGLVAWPVERFRAAQQYDPVHGYRDNESDRGWGAIVRYVHRNLRRQRIAFHGAGTFFPLYGDHLDNELVAVPEEAGAAEALELCRAQRVDWLVCFVPSSREGFEGAFRFGTSLLADLRRVDPSLEVVLEDQGSALVRLRR